MSTNGPGFPGPFSCARWIAEIAGICDKLARSATAHKNHLQRGISYTRIRLTLIPTRAYQGDGHVQSATDSERDLAKDGQCVHASAFSCASLIYNWPKGADVAPVGLSYNSSLHHSQ